MDKKDITNFQFSTLNYFITRAFLIGITFNCLINVMKQDSWIIPLIGLIIGIIFCFFIIYIMNYKPNLNIAEKVIKLFNKNIGKIFVIIIIFITFIFCILNYLNLNNFIHSQFLNKTPVLAISLLFITTTLYVLTKGFNTVCRTSNILFYINILLYIFTLIGLLFSIKIDNLKPFFQSNNYIRSLNFYYIYNITPMFLLTIIPKNNIKNEKIKKALLISYIISAISIFFVIFTTIATFGYELTKLYEYPEFHVLKHISIIGLSTRIEGILVIQFILDLFIYNIFSIYFMSTCINSTFNIKNKNIFYFIISILIVITTNILSKYNIFIDNITLKFFPIPISIIMSLIIIIICVKIKISK